MENSEFAVSGNASQSITHPIECKQSERSNIYYTRSTTIPANDNLRFFDHGNLQVASSGCVANQLIGELWISFDITLYKPQLFGSLGNNILFAEVDSVDPSDTTPFNIAQMSLHNASIPVYPFNSNTSSTSISFTDDSITFPPSLHGRSFQIQYCIFGTAASVGQYEHVYSNCSAGRSVWSTYSDFSSSTAVAANFTQLTTIKLDGDQSLPATISYITGSNPNATSTLRVNIYQIPN